MAELDSGIIANLATTKNPVQMLQGKDVAQMNNINADTAHTQAEIPLVHAQTGLIGWQAKTAEMDYGQAQAMINASKATWSAFSPQTQTTQDANGQPVQVPVKGTGGATASSPVPARPNQDPTVTEPGSTVPPVTDPSVNPLTLNVKGTPSQPLTTDQVHAHITAQPVQHDGDINPLADEFIQTQARNMANAGVRADTIQNYMTTAMKTRAEIAEHTATAANSNLKFQQNTADSLMSLAKADPQSGRQAILHQFGVDIATPGGQAYMARLASASENSTSVTSNDVKKLDMQLAPLKLAIERQNADTSAFSASTGRLTALVDQAKVPITTAPLIADQQKTAVIASGVERQAQQVAGINNLVNQLRPLADVNTNIIAADKVDPGVLSLLKSYGLKSTSNKIDLNEVIKLANGKLGQLDSAIQSGEGVIGGMGSDARARMTAQGAGEYNITDNAATIAAKTKLFNDYASGAATVAGTKREGANGLIGTMTNAINKASPGSLTPEQAAGLQIDAAGVAPTAPPEITPKGTLASDNPAPKGSGGAPAKVDANKVQGPKSFTLAEARAFAKENKMSTDDVVKALAAKGVSVK